PDPVLGCPAERVDMIVGEVKEGVAHLNDATRDPAVLGVALSRFGCCGAEHAHEIARRLVTHGHADTPEGHVVRMVAFGAAPERASDPRATIVPTRSPLPPRLWAAAVALVPEHGLYGTARALHLDYGTLKRHVDGRRDQVHATMPAGFVELATPVPPARDPWLIEIEGMRGTVRVRLNGLALTDLAEFARLVVGAGA